MRKAQAEPQAKPVSVARSNAHRPSKSLEDL